MNQEELNANIGTMTQILQQLDAGDPSTEELVYRMQYGNLRRLASQVLGACGGVVTQGDTEMLNELLLQLKNQAPMRFKDMEHFLAIAREKMREIVYAYARSRRSRAPTNSGIRISIADILTDFRHNGLATADAEPERVLSLQHLLERLANNSERDCDLVDLFFFVGLSQADIAARYGVTEDVIRKRLQFIRAWLNAQDNEMNVPRGAV